MIDYEKLDQYFERFDDMFPLSMLNGYTEQEKLNILQECLDKDKPYDELYDVDYGLKY